MRRDFLLSILLHVCFIAATFVTSPFDTRPLIKPGETIRVSLTAMPAFASDEPEPLAPLIIPQAIEEELPEIPIDAPTTRPAVKENKKPAETKPQPKTDKPYNPQTKTGDKTQAGTSNGKIDATTTGYGSPFAGATVDNVTFNKYPYWYDQAFSKILRNWSNPVVSDGAIVCVIYFQVIKSGRMIEAKIEKTSGIPAFDNACLLAVQKASPFPPLPREFREEIIGITLPFKYEPR
ncbi:MAG: TonB family protein [candidate division Zixibacteria bacterium]|nr:TonB family protein [candidate division Zixibacteria bacterium]